MTRCECGKVTGEACTWVGPVRDTVVLDYMPEHLRASHHAAGNAGRWPHNGAIRIRVERLLTVAELGERWSMSPTSVRALIQGGQLAHVRIGKSLRVRARTADEYVRRVERTS